MSLERARAFFAQRRTALSLDEGRIPTRSKAGKPGSMEDGAKSLTSSIGGTAGSGGQGGSLDEGYIQRGRCCKWRVRSQSENVEDKHIPPWTR